MEGHGEEDTCTKAKEPVAQDKTPSTDPAIRENVELPLPAISPQANLVTVRSDRSVLLLSNKRYDLKS
jgi:hypothetical protein